MDLNAIEALLAVSATGTVAAAARQLDVSRSSIRRRLDALEAEVGAVLVHRDDAGVRLTPAGRLFAARGETLVRTARAAAKDARAASKKPEGTVRMIAPLSAPVDIRSRALDAIGRMNPGLQLDLIEAEDPLQHLDDDFDMLVHFGEPIENGSYYVRSIARVLVGLMASPAYLAKHGAPRTVADLADHRLLTWRLTREIPSALPVVGGAPHPVRPALASANMELIREMAAQGCGIGWGALAPLGPADEARELVPVLPGVCESSFGVWLLCPLPSRLDPRVRVMLDGLVQLMEAINLG